MRSPNDSSFDLQLPGRLSRRLARHDGAAPAAPAYCRFSLARLAPALGPAAATAGGAPPPPPQPPQIPLDPDGYGSWDELLSWCLSTHAARSALVVSPDGFVIAFTGAEPAAGFEGLGADLSAAVHQLGRCGERADEDAVAWFSLEYSSSWLNGISIMAPTGSAFIFALIGDGPSPEPVRKATVRQIRYSLRHLD